MTHFDVTTPLGENQRCDSDDEVTDAIRAYMESDPDANLGRVQVIAVRGQRPVDAGDERPPSDFWPPATVEHSSA
jgi:hypothetical protein